MKISIVFILFFAHYAILAANSQTRYTPLNTQEISSSMLIQDLRQLGAEFTLQKLIFDHTPSIPNGHWEIIKTESAALKTINGTRFLKFQVQIRCLTTPYLIRARFVVSFTISTGDTLVRSYCYQVLDKNPKGPLLEDAPNYVDLSLLDPNLLIGNFLDFGIDYAISDAIQRGLLGANTNYDFVRAFRVKDVGTPDAPGYSYLVQISNTEGYNRRYEIIVESDSPTSAPLGFSYVIFPNNLRE